MGWTPICADARLPVPARNAWLSPRLLVSPSSGGLRCSKRLTDHVRAHLTSSPEYFEAFTRGMPFCLPSGVLLADVYRATVARLAPGLERVSALRRGGVNRCAVVGSSGYLHGSGLGPQIDAYDAVFRMNDAPTAGFEADVGSRTTFRVLYAESARPRGGGFGGEHLLFAALKPADVAYLAHVLLHAPGDAASYAAYPRARPNASAPHRHFFRDVAPSVSLPPERVSWLAPQLFLWTAELLGQAGFTSSRRHRGRQPSTGLSAAVFALHFCTGPVDLFGFSWGKNDR